jgi:hypothetical protein
LKIKNARGEFRFPERERREHAPPVTGLERFLLYLTVFLIENIKGEEERGLLFLRHLKAHTFLSYSTRVHVKFSYKNGRGLFSSTKGERISAAADAYAWVVRAV